MADKSLGQKVVYWVGNLFALVFLGGLLSIIGGYIAYKRSNKTGRFWDVLRWKPWIIVGMSFLLTLFFLGPLAYIIGNIVSFFLVRNRCKN